ncbi:Os01g0392600 [Oryza sativa Japonica Group]|uniref:Os01g0392600 protein n=1 Tax=Oryza sativa subsp. japonica TaxID=39947 RepID=A0A0P0V2X1_ORYSJ|nr:Os01g0392600 [Oryza sativa Japonica Group]
MELRRSSFPRTKAQTPVECCLWSGAEAPLGSPFSAAAVFVSMRGLSASSLSIYALFTLGTVYYLLFCVPLQISG